MFNIKIAKETAKIPGYDVDKMRIHTKNNPKWIHFGGGNLYRCFHAKVMQDLIEQNLESSGIVVVETFNKKLVEYYKQYDNESLSVIMKADGTIQSEIILSSADVLFLSKEEQYQENYINLVDYFTKPSLQLITLTITEKGYLLKNTDGSLTQNCLDDIQSGPNLQNLKTTIAMLCCLLYKRYKAKQKAIALVSTDNFSHNGEVLKAAITLIAKAWIEQKKVEVEFLYYVENQVTYPISMIDRITPLPSIEVAKQLKEIGIEGKNSQHNEIEYFVNTEEVHYLVIEDNFPNGRPAMEKVGVLLTDKDTVNKVDLMKVCSCLNPLHTTLAIFGCLLGYEKIYDEMQDPDLLSLVKKLGYQENLKVVEDPKIINPKKFIDEVINVRFNNSKMPDTAQRIATDTSQKISIRFGENIKKYQALNQINELVFIPFVLASWLRYLLAINDSGESFTPSSDPLLEQLQEALKDISMGSNLSKQEITKILTPILTNNTIFGCNLVTCNLAEKIVADFMLLIQGRGAVRKVLKEKLTNN